MSVDIRYVTIRVELCKSCYKRAVQSLQKIAESVSKETTG